MDRIAAEHVRRNERSRDCWDSFAPHRQRIAELLVGGNCSGGRLCLLGAGNCNDVDLKSLSGANDEVHLVDLDTGALASAVKRQGAGSCGNITCHGGLDLSGIATQLDQWSPDQPPADVELQSCLAAAGRASVSDLPGPFDVVASVCLLTQLLEAAVITLGPGHPRLNELVIAVRTHHLRLLVELTAPGGRVVLVTDVVSSDTWPGLADVPENAIPQMLAAQINRHNFFTGTNPLVLRGLLEEDNRVGSVRIHSPWRWKQRTRTYAVCAMTGIIRSE